MKQVFFTGEELFNNGYDLKEIATLLIEKSSELVKNPDGNQSVFSHNELEREKIYAPSNSFSFSVPYKNFFLIITSDIFNFFNIKIRNLKIKSEKYQENHYEKTRKSIRLIRGKRRAWREGAFNTSKLEEVAVQINLNAFYTNEDTDEEFFLFFDHEYDADNFPSIIFETRYVGKDEIFKEMYDIKFKILPYEFIEDYSQEINKVLYSSENLFEYFKKNTYIKNYIMDKSIEFRSKIIFFIKGYDFFVIADDNNFENNFKRKGSIIPLSFEKESKYFKVYNKINIKNSEYNEYLKYIHENCFKYFYKDKELNFKEQYFIFDFEKYCKLYHYFDAENECEKYFINYLLKLKFNINEIMKIKDNKSIKHLRVVEFLKNFYTEICEFSGIHKIYTGILFYLQKLNRKSNKEAFYNVSNEHVTVKNIAPYVSKELNKLAKHAEKEGIPYIEHLFIIYNPQNKAKFCDNEEEILFTLRECIKNCKNEKALQVIENLKCKGLDVLE